MKTPPKLLRPVFLLWRDAFSKIARVAKNKPFRAVALALAVLLLLLYSAVYSAPRSFPVGETISIPRGMTLEEAARTLQEKHIIQSPFLLRGAIILLGKERAVHAGEYYFEKRQGVFTIAHRLSVGDFGFVPVAVRVPEGANVKEIAALLERSLNPFNAEKFISLAEEYEGYLFPDTYYFLPTVSPEEIIEQMRQTFRVRTSEVASDIDSFGRPLEEVVIMASLLEREAHDLHTKQKIAGVLWRRIDIGMPLQVDAVFVYLLGKGSDSLTKEDLNIDSPYNTYRYRGLPPGPIGNPSLESIKAAATPSSSEYLYYLADKKGETHFSKTFDEHKEKKELYLN